MENVPYELLVSGNQIYQNHQARWKYLLDSYVGGQAYRNGQYLTKYQLETPLEYQARIENTPLDNQCSSIISVYNSFLFRECPERNFGGIENMPELLDFVDDVDFEGRSLDAFMKEVSTWAGVFGACWVIMSKPNIDAVTRADEQAVMLRPYMSMLTPLVVLDWNWSRDACGRYSLDYFKYVEDINGNIQTIRTWTPELITTHTVNAVDKVVIDYSEEINQLGLIPAVIVYNGRSIVRGLGSSAINDIADLQRFIYNCLSEVDQSIRMDSHPSLVKTPETQAGIGPGSIIQMPENMDPQLKPYVLEFSGANIASIYQAIDAAIASVEKIANVGAVRATATRNASGVALQTEFALLNARLAEMADNLELAEEQLWDLFCMYQGVQAEIEVSYPDNFDMRDKGNEINQLKTLSECGAVDPRVRQAIDATILGLLDLDYDEMAAITDPTIYNPETVQEPGELPEQED